MPRREALLAAGLVLLIVQPALAQGMADATAAFDAGDYPTAERIWSDMASRGDARAMVSLAGLYDVGLAPPPQGVTAKGLYRRAARLGDADAMQNYAEILEREGTDTTGAACWYARAAAAGRSWAARQHRRLRPDTPVTHTIEQEDCRSRD